MKAKRNNQRYQLHYRLKKTASKDHALLAVRQRTFFGIPSSEIAKKLITEFGYVIQTSIPN